MTPPHPARERPICRSGWASAPAKAGHRVAFATAAQWVARLAEAHHAGRLQDELVKLGRVPLLIVDEVGYIPFEAEAANLFFQLVSNRYERASLIVTSNKPFGRWGEVFGDDIVAAAMIVRLVHHAEVVPQGRQLPAQRPRPRPRPRSWQHQGVEIKELKGGQYSAGTGWSGFRGVDTVIVGFTRPVVTDILRELVRWAARTVGLARGKGLSPRRSSLTSQRSPTVAAKNWHSRSEPTATLSRVTGAGLVRPKRRPRCYVAASPS
jgi:hypothetical protein